MSKIFPSMNSKPEKGTFFALIPYCILSFIVIPTAPTGRGSLGRSNPGPLAGDRLPCGQHPVGDLSEQELLEGRVVHGVHGF